jgi:hypothetical protein
MIGQAIGLGPSTRTPWGAGKAVKYGPRYGNNQLPGGRHVTLQSQTHPGLSRLRIGPKRQFFMVNV